MSSPTWYSGFSRTTFGAQQILAVFVTPCCHIKKVSLAFHFSGSVAIKLTDVFHTAKNPADDVASESSTTDEGKATQIHACSRKVHSPRKVQPTCAALAVKVCLSTSSLNYFAIYFNKFHILWHYIPFPGPKINNAHNAATHDLYLPTTHTHTCVPFGTQKKKRKKHGPNLRLKIVPSSDQFFYLGIFLCDRTLLFFGLLASGAGAMENELEGKWEERTFGGCPHKRYSNLLRALSKHIHI